MIRYHVKHSKKSRRTLRFLGLFLFLFGVLVVWLFFSGNAAGHLIGAILGALIGLYGGYLFIHSFELDKYDIDYEFSEDSMTIKHVRGTTVYNYNEITDVTLVVPDNEMIYSLIQIKVKRSKFLIPFTYKKELCDRIYQLLTEKVTLRELTEEIEAAKKKAAEDAKNAEKESEN
ncbi:MAG: hypothetical protein IKQ49_01625 [Eubacterium sp.]|nr:hypothetical protein [Eubacterium sp.]